MTDTAFQTDSRACYQVRALTADEALGYGCPDATDMLIGRNGHIIGTIIRSTGRAVRVPGWPSRKGYRATFVPWGAPETGAPFKGWEGA